MKRACGLLLLCVPLVWGGLGAPDCEFHMEVMALASSQEAWLSQQSDSRAWLIPSWNGAPRVNKPPLLVWINLLAWRGLPPGASVETLVQRARQAAASPVG